MKFQVEVVYALPDTQTQITVDCELPISIQEVIERSGITRLHPEIEIADGLVGIHGSYQNLDHAVLPGDRVEIYRPLQMSPTEARKMRAAARKPGGQ